MSQQQRLQSLGREIRALRQSLGITQQELAERCGFDTTYISMLERGKRNPPFLTLCRLAAGLETPLAAMLHRLA